MVERGIPLIRRRLREEQRAGNRDEFRDMLKKIIEADPEGKNVGGLTQALPSLLGGFLYPYGGIIDKKWVVKDDQFVPG